VTIVEMLPQIALLEDEEVSRKLQRALTRCGIGQTYENRIIPLQANGKALGSGESVEVVRIIVVGKF